MQEALAWLLTRYSEVKLWMGVETEEGAEWLLIPLRFNLGSFVLYNYRS